MTKKIRKNKFFEERKIKSTRIQNQKENKKIGEKAEKNEISEQNEKSLESEKKEKPNRIDKKRKNDTKILLVNLKRNKKK